MNETRLGGGVVYRLHGGGHLRGRQDWLKGTVEPRLIAVTKLPMPRDERFQYIAILGDLDHKKFCYEVANRFGKDIELYFTNYHQARWLETHRPDLVVRDPAGNYPSDHSLGSIFEYHFATEPKFRIRYGAWLIEDLRPGSPFVSDYWGVHPSRLYQVCDCGPGSLHRCAPYLFQFALLGCVACFLVLFYFSQH
jgi:hypothetical protein